MNPTKPIRFKSTGSRQRPSKTSNLLTEGSDGAKERIPSPSPYLQSHHLLDVIPLAPSTTLAGNNKFSITNFSNNILNKIDIETRIIQPTPKPFKVRPSKHYKATKSYLNNSNENTDKSFSRYDPVNNTDIAGSSTPHSSVQSRAERNRRLPASQQRPRESIGTNKLPSFTINKRASTSANYSPTARGLDESILKPRNSVIKPIQVTDQQKIARRAALKYFTSIEEMNSVQNARVGRSANLPIRTTKESIKASEMTHLLRGKIHSLIRQKIDPSPPFNLRAWTRIGYTKDFTLGSGIHQMAYNF